MATVTVIVPTFDHQQTLNYSLGSLQRQDYQDFEVVVIGDGSPRATEEIVQRFQQQDSRFRFINNPKSPRTGEPYRDELIRNLDSKYIAYLGDDDLWLPWHLGNLVQALQDAEFAYSSHVLVNMSGSFSGFLTNPQSDILRSIMAGVQLQCFGLTFVAHSREAYLSLEKGWETTPWGNNTDVYMWGKWARDSTVRFSMTPYPSALHLHSVIRPFVTNDERAEELRFWSDRIAQYDSPARLADKVSYVEYFERVLAKLTPKSLATFDDVLLLHKLTLKEPASPDLPNRGQELFLNDIQYRCLALAWAQYRGTYTPSEARRHWEILLREAPDVLEHRFMLLLTMATSGQNKAMETYLNNCSYGVNALLDITRWFGYRKLLGFKFTCQLERNLIRLHAPPDAMAIFSGELSAAGHNDFAFRILTEIIDLYPQNVGALSSMAELNLQQNNPDKAVQLLTKAARDGLSSGLIWLLYGKALARTGEWYAALDAFEHASSYNIMCPDIFAEQALCFWNSGQKGRAQEMLCMGNQAYSTSPEMKWANSQIS